MTIGILKERAPERRVALTPEAAQALKSLKINIVLESGAGEEAFIDDNAFIKAGVNVVSRSAVLAGSDCILTVSGPLPGEYESWGNNKILIGHLSPANGLLLDKLMTHRISAFSLDLLPRTTLAQSMDILSSMSTVSGYKAVLDAAGHLPRFFPMFMSASGTVKPARVLILGAGVAGLQALATARRLGAVVEVFDVRSAVKEEVHSLGGRFIEVPGAIEDRSAGGYAVEQQEEYRKKQVELIHNHALKSDVIICTAQLPGKKAPILIRKETVELMNHGSVIVDLAASTGGNCELSNANSTILHKGVIIIGKVDYPSMMPMDASRMYSNNLVNFVRLLLDNDGNVSINWNDEIIKSSCLAHEGKILNERLLSAMKG
ncbi:MAG TPA: NAD(P) transhydrogenase subunit alpha [Bacteroidales bacterium]|jgi:NAD(P) transhydrogenase subunit alpha|nr:NAD(P) transhydrogenase subunit alpha [Bacteroidales bacterium]